MQIILKYVIIGGMIACITDAPAAEVRGDDIKVIREGNYECVWLSWGKRMLEGDSAVNPSYCYPIKKEEKK